MSVNIVEYDLTASIVTFHTPIQMLNNAIESFLESDSLKKQVIIIDNSSSKMISDYANSKKLIYIDPKKNIGFGSGHNLAIKLSTIRSKYHVILNPDTITHQNALNTLYHFMESSKEVQLCAPKILNPDGTIQYVHKELPSVFIIFARRFFPKFLKMLIRSALDKYELKNFKYDQYLVVPSISGSFMFFRKSCLLRINGFDERFFMYMEDIDISRRSSYIGPSVVVTDATITHLWSRGSYKFNKLMLYNISSCIKYFIKWGPGVDLTARPYSKVNHN